MGVEQREGDGPRIAREVQEFFRDAQCAFAKEDIPVRTQRVVLSPFRVDDNIDTRHVGSVVSWFSQMCHASGIRWFCVPFATSGQEMQEINGVAMEIARRYKNAFINYIVSSDGEVRRRAILYASRFIKAVAGLANNGYDNFRIGASFNCRPHGPFFPFTYHEGPSGFSLALELVPLFVETIEQARDQQLETVRERLLERILPMLARVEEVGRQVEQNTGMTYFGADCSLAPFPDSDEGSVARIIELLGVDAFGSYGTTFLTSYLTDIIRQMIAISGITSVGFNGVMYSLLEDTRLAANNRSNEFSIESLIAFSTMCGCGVDMVPVPGDIFEEEIASIMMDIAAVATRLNKPLGVRLLPIPGKRAQEFTEFSYDFLCNTRIHKATNRACFNGLLDVGEPFAYIHRKAA